MPPKAKPVVITRSESIAMPIPARALSLLLPLLSLPSLLSLLLPLPIGYLASR
ncbi:MAG: hypothetical protein V4488_12920 [Pseudomonadota bacterium]